MWRIKSINIENLGSFKKQFIQIDCNKSYIIIGDNQDKPDQKSNGSGKSWILESIALGLLAIPLKSIPISDVIRDGEDEMNITLKMVNDIYKKEMSIVRNFHRKKSLKTTVELNGVDQKDKFVQKDSTQFILNHIGISKDDLLYYYIVSRKRFKDFFSTSDTIKKDIVSRFSGTDVLKGIDKTIEKDITLIENDILDLQRDWDKLKGQKITYLELIEEIKERDIEKEKKQKIEIINTKIDGCINSIKAGDKAKKENSSLILKVTEKIKGVDNSISTFIKEIELQQKKLDKKISDKNDIFEKASKEEFGLKNKFREVERSINKKIFSYEDNLQKTKRKKDAYKHNIEELEAKINGSVECPICNHKFDLSDKEFSIEEAKNVEIPNIKDQIVELDKLIKKYDDKIQSSEKKIGKLKKLLSEELQSIKEKYSAKINSLDKNIEELNNGLKDLREKSKNCQIEKVELELKIDNLKRANLRVESEKTSLLKDIQSFEAEIEKTKKLNLDDEIKKYDDKIESLDFEIEEYSNEIDLKDQNKLDINKWIYRFKKFNSYLANEAISIIQGKTNDNLSKSGSDIRVKIDGFKILKSGEIREKISATIFRDGIDKGSFEKLSEGEKAKVISANIVALQDIINSTSEFGGLDFLGIDEILDSLDELGISLIADTISKLKRTCLLISHVGTQTISYENMITVQIKNEESKII